MNLIIKPCEFHQFYIKLFNSLNYSNLDYCVVRNYEGLPFSKPGGDVDILINQSQEHLFLEHLVSVAKSFDAQVNTKHKGIIGLYKLYRELKKEKITHIADFHNVLRSKLLRALFILSGKPSVSINKGRAEKKH